MATLIDYESDEDSSAFENLLLDKGTFEPKVIYLDDMVAMGNLDLDISYENNWALSLLPLGYSSYEKRTPSIHLNNTPQEALDDIKNRYYPEMEKVDLSYDDEISSNYATLLGYEIPQYYYKDENATLSYTSIYSNTGIFHLMTNLST